MSLIANRLRRAFYLDSIALMRLSAQIASRDGIIDAVLMIGTDNNKRLLADAGLLTDTGREGGANDLIIAVRAEQQQVADDALTNAYAALDDVALSGRKGQWRATASLNGALQALPDANLALVSTPGEYAVREAERALERGLNVLMFSDNVPLQAEIALKRAARERNLILMGPDCGTALLAGRPLAFCNVVPRGPLGVVAASGTGLQEVMSLAARCNAGVSHGIGVGGRDLQDAVGGISTLTALELLADDPATECVLLISKPPGEETARRVYERLADIGKPAVVCNFGLDQRPLPAPLRTAATLQAAVEISLGVTLAQSEAPRLPDSAGGRRRVHGLYTGGTLCSEALAIFHQAGVPVTSNVPLPGQGSTTDAPHEFVDLGADEFTQGRPHPMLDPQLRNSRVQTSLADPEVAAILVDVVLGYGAHPDPAAVLLEALGAVAGRQRPLMIASVCGTDSDPQNRTRQVKALRDAGVAVAGSNAEAAGWALRLAQQCG